MKILIFMLALGLSFSQMSFANDAERFFGQLLNTALGGNQPAQGQTTLRFQPQHGGDVVRANANYIFELVLAPNGMFKLYVYDSAGKSLNVQGVRGMWAVSPQSRYALQGDFNHDIAGEYFWVKFPKHDSKMLHVSVAIEAGGNSISAEHYLEVANF